MSYVEAREIVFIARNIHGGWHGAGLFPIDKQKVLRHLPRLRTPSPPATASETQPTPFGLQTVTSSPLDAETLRCINPVLNRLVATQEPSHTLARKYVNRLTDTSERLCARVAILESENTTLKNTI